MGVLDMNKRIVEINCCSMCPHFDYKYYDWAEKCSKLSRKIDQIEYEKKIELDTNIEYPIPNDCPLKREEK